MYNEKGCDISKILLPDFFVDVTNIHYWTTLKESPARCRSDPKAKPKLGSSRVGLMDQNFTPVQVFGRVYGYCFCRIWVAQQG